jgi:hypothetical protein
MCVPVLRRAGDLRHGSDAAAIPEPRMVQHRPAGCHGTGESRAAPQAVDDLWINGILDKDE